MEIPILGKVKHPSRLVVGVVVIALSMGAIAFGVNRRLTSRLSADTLTVPATAEDLTLRITASGSVVAIDTVNLSPKTAGRVEELLVEQGDRVTEGQLIARMENDELEAQRLQALANLDQAEARLAQLRAGTRSEELAQAQQSLRQAEAAVVQAQSRLDLAKQRVQRNQRLYQEGAIARDTLDEVMNEVRSAEANLFQAQARAQEVRDRLIQLQNGTRPEEITQAEAQVAEASARLRGVNTQIEDTFIRAPFAGVITQKYAVEGAFVTPTTSASNTTSATSTSIVALASGQEVLADVPEVDIRQIRQGQRVEIRVDAYPDEIFEGKVRLIAPAAVEEQNVTSFQVRVTIVSGQNKIRTGMNADLTFLGERLDNALVVPTVSIVTREGRTGVYVPGPAKKVEFRPVTIGASVGDQTQILEGLQPGERVYVDLPERQRPGERSDP